jgi:hypothetical protein
MHILIALATIGAGLYLLYATAQATDALVNPRTGLRNFASILMVLGGLASLRRSLDNASGMLAMAEQRNIFCGMPIIRFQIDTAMNLFARTPVDDVAAFMRHIAEGKERRDFKDRSGKKLTAACLHKQLNTKHEEVSNLYEETSGYVHFLRHHLHRVLDLNHFKRTQEIRFADIEQLTAGWSDEELCGALVCFIWATEAILTECKEWRKKRALA